MTRSFLDTIGRSPISNPGSPEPDSTRVLLDAAVDQWQVLASPADGPLEPRPQHSLGLEPKHALGLLRAAEALARSVPLPRRSEVERGRVGCQPVDQLGQLEDGGLDAAGEI